MRWLHLWQSWGVQPTAVMGHSVGEYVAACVAGVFSLEDGLKLIAERGRLMQSLPQTGDMVAVFADEATVARAIEPFRATVSIAASNGPEHIVISGVRADLQAMIDQMTARGIQSRRLTVSHAFHSPLMQPILDAFEQTAAKIHYVSPQIDLISNVTGQRATSENTSAAYWCQHILAPVQFAASMATLQQQGYNAFVEIGPQPTLLSMARRCLPDSQAMWLPSLRSGREDWLQLLESLGTLWVHGADIDWAGFDRDYDRRRVVLPTYPFQRERCWLAAPRVKAEAERVPEAALHPLLERQVYSPLFAETTFESRLGTASPGFLDDHRLYGLPLFPATGYLEAGLAAATQSLGGDAHAIEAVEIQEALILPENEACTVQVILAPGEAGQAAFRVFSRQDKNWRLHASGSIGAAESAVATPGPLSLNDVRARCTEAVSSEAYYQQLAEIGIGYGPAFRGIRQLWRRDGEALGQIALPESAAAEARAYQLHPALLDACFQTFGAAVFDTTGTSSPNVYVPVGIERYRVYQSGRDRGWCQAILRAPQSAETLTGDLQIFDENGQVIAEVIGLQLRRVSRAAIQQATDQQLGHWLYALEWRTQLLPATGESSEAGHWIIFADRGGVGDALAAALRARGEACLVAKAGDLLSSVGRWPLAD